MELLDIACEELKPVRESHCLVVFKVVFIVKLSIPCLLPDNATRFRCYMPLTKTVVAVLTVLFPKIVCKYLGGERQKRVEALIIEEKAPKIVEKYLNNYTS